MNDHWIEASKLSNIRDFPARADTISNYEIWLDAMNLHETCWMLFAWNKDRTNRKYGWPGGQHE